MRMPLLKREQPHLLISDQTQHESLQTDKQNCIYKLILHIQLYNILSSFIEGVHHYLSQVQNQHCQIAYHTPN